MNSSLASNNKYFFCFTSIFFIASYLLYGEALGQIVPDNTLPQNSIVTTNEGIMEITGGTSVGSNLFHSFSEFSLTTGNTAFFDNAINIQNILSRITGGGISNIDGLIKANGTANLFLINPSGIVFGENATLDLGGSFIAGTANSIKFTDGSEFSAINPQAPPLLTVNIPIGLQYGTNSGDVTVKGSGHNAFFDFDTFTVDRFERNSGLEVAPNQTLGLAGKNILLEGGNLTAPEGNLELISIGEAGTVELIPGDLGWNFAYSELGGNIDLTNSASINVSGKGSGNIQIQASVVNLTDGSAIFAETEGNTPGSLTHITANDVNIIGTDPDINLPSSIWSNVLFDATEDGGDVLIEAGSLLLKGGGQVNVNTFGLGNAGQMNIRAQDIKVIGESEYGDFFSGLFAQPDIFLTGKGGNILIEADSLLIADGAQVNATTFGEGNAGSVIIKAKEIELTGTSELGISGLFTSSEAEGKGGDLTIETNSLKILDGAQIFVGTRGSGNAGNLRITADQIELSGGDELGASGIYGSALLGTGAGGNLNLDINKLSIQDGATISVSNFFSRGDGEPGQGSAGSINIKANSLEMSSTNSEFPSSITASTNDGGGGNINLNIAGDIALNNNSEIIADTRGNADGGNINITGDQFNLNNQSQVSVDSDGAGQAGNIEIRVDSLNANQGKISANSTQTGGGDITLIANSTLLDNDSELSTSVFNGNGGGGDVTIDSKFIIVRDDSAIRANAIQGDGGNINIDTEVILQSLDSEITASSEFGLDGVVEINSPDTDNQIGLLELPEKIVDPTSLIAGQCLGKSNDTFAATGKGGLADNPSQSLRGESVWEDLRNFANAPSLARESDVTANDKIIEAKAWNINNKGNVELLSYIPQSNNRDYGELFNQCRS
ncbi:filamentous hemagglutinin N-terminal domain-containing protein [Pleurocapsa sp. PCC 7319]|uniref:two-partner secretion domain-containing protein n=1 Tax=Pleurocapsa sp. PCC 7319 TaxID=118161 RepID=UPI0008FC0E2D|nr:filamentous hemagglutinin N-terminal domain-containing protein [Pleurocapsa sp. PCC 7319]